MNVDGFERIGRLHWALFGAIECRVEQWNGVWEWKAEDLTTGECIEGSSPTQPDAELSAKAAAVQLFVYENQGDLVAAARVAPEGLASSGRSSGEGEA